VPLPELLRLPYRSDSSAWYDALRGLSWPVWLDSGFPRSGSGRFDIIAADPYVSLVQDRDGLRLVKAGGAAEPGRPDDPLAALRALMGAPGPTVAGLPFPGGAVGFLGYDLARAWGDLPPREGLDDWPDLAVGLYDWALVVDHAHQRASLVRQGRDPRGERPWREARERLAGAAELAPPAPPADADLELLAPGMPFERYAAAFERIQRYIREGDCYQVNLAQRFRAQVGEDGWSLYRHMRERNPSPYGALLEYPFGEVLSFSPEQFLGLDGGRVQTRPIKGTRPRGGDAAQDLALRAELLASPKDRAENLMIVDLLRNDLGKVCVPGSIEVPGLFELESFATVHHLVSTVRGRLAPGRDAVDLLRACFPGGSITGAPKRRAMQIIDELEPVRREIYCGSVFRLGFDGGLDSSIAIRTVLKRGREALYWAGGGIVADSDPQAEYAECLDKAAPFLRLFGRGRERAPG
jgi:para-aminobenzoate synthetase component 1